MEKSREIFYLFSFERLLLEKFFLEVLKNQFGGKMWEIDLLSEMDIGLGKSRESPSKIFL
jgi:hypothetical protein